MNREIKFRGKSFDDHIFPKPRWVYGFLSISALGSHKIHFQNEDYSWTIVDVMPETIGQFTGLRDKDGVGIYEGDILYCQRYDCVGKVGFQAGCFTFELDDEEDYSGNLLRDSAFCSKIIGKTHDSPELLNN
jgi:hypothetical protein